MKPRDGKQPPDSLDLYRLGFPCTLIGRSVVVNADCLKWLAMAQPNSVHAVVTDPPYGVKEYHESAIHRLRNGNRGGMWRLPPVLDGVQRSPLPRFTALTAKEKQAVEVFFLEWARMLLPVVRPGGHLFLASNAFLSQHVFSAIIEAGWDFRCEVIRLVQTLRGGDRPKLHEKEFPNVCSLPRGCYEPWGVFRKPLPAGLRAGECLSLYGTGGIRCLEGWAPFKDVIPSERTPRDERKLADHPSQKPISFMRQLVRASLPLGTGVVLDPFAGSGSTIAAGEIEGVQVVGIERDSEYYQKSLSAVPALVRLRQGAQLSLGLPEQD